MDFIRYENFAIEGHGFIHGISTDHTENRSTFYQFLLDNQNKLEFENLNGKASIDIVKELLSSKKKLDILNELRLFFTHRYYYKLYKIGFGGYTKLEENGVKYNVSFMSIRLYFKSTNILFDEDEDDLVIDVLIRKDADYGDNHDKPFDNYFQMHHKAITQSFIEYTSMIFSYQMTQFEKYYRDKYLAAVNKMTEDEALDNITFYFSRSSEMLDHYFKRYKFKVDPNKISLKNFLISDKIPMMFIENHPVEHARIRYHNESVPMEPKNPRLIDLTHLFKTMFKNHYDKPLIFDIEIQPDNMNSFIFMMREMNYDLDFIDIYEKGNLYYVTYVFIRMSDIGKTRTTIELETVLSANPKCSYKEEGIVKLTAKATHRKDGGSIETPFYEEEFIMNKFHSCYFKEVTEVRAVSHDDDVQSFDNRSDSYYLYLRKLMKKINNGINNKLDIILGYTGSKDRRIKQYAELINKIENALNKKEEN